jgi:hypothetical protein
MTTTTVVIDEARALELLEQAVAERGPDYVYRAPVCVYSTPGGQPACLVGHALALAGLELSRLGENNPAASYLPHYFPEVTEPAVNVFIAAQAAQDDRLTWGEALAEAREAVS